MTHVHGNSHAYHRKEDEALKVTWKATYENARSWGSAFDALMVVRDVFEERGAVFTEIKEDDGICNFQASFEVPGRGEYFTVYLEDNMLWWYVNDEQAEEIGEYKGSPREFLDVDMHGLPDLRPTEASFDIVSLVSLWGEQILSDRVRHSLDFGDQTTDDLIRAASWIGYAMVDHRYRHLLTELRRPSHAALTPN